MSPQFRWFINEMCYFFIFNKIFNFTQKRGGKTTNGMDLFQKFWYNFWPIGLLTLNGWDKYLTHTTNAHANAHVVHLNLSKCFYLGVYNLRHNSIPRQSLLEKLHFGSVDTNKILHPWKQTAKLIWFLTIIQSKTTENITFGIPYYQLHVRIHMEPLPRRHPQHNLLDSF